MGGPDTVLMLALWYVVFLLSITCHEAAHAWAAHLGGDDTAYLGGQVSLNPLPHIRREIFGTVIIPVMTYFYMGWMMGWASAPYDPGWEERHPRRAAGMAFAGPLANLLLAVAGFALLKGGIAAGAWAPSGQAWPPHALVAVGGDGPAFMEGLARFGSVTLVLNLVLFLFNLMPFPPMDGASVLAGLFRPARELRRKFVSMQFGSLIGLLAAWILFPKIYGPVHLWVVGLLY